MRALLLDTETTGLNRDKDFVISIGAILYDTKTKKIEDQFYSVLDWTQVTDKIEIPEYITAINGFTIESLKEEGLHPKESLDLFYDFLVKDGIPRFEILSAFNLPFDYGMMKSNSLTIDHKLFKLLNREIKHTKGIILFDSCHYDRMFHSGFNPDGTVIKHNMASVGERYQIEDEGTAHNALDDTKFLTKIFEKRLSEIKLNKRKINKAFENEMALDYSMLKYAENQSFYANEVKGIEL